MIPIARRHLLLGGLSMTALMSLPRVGVSGTGERVVLTDSGGSTETAYAKAFYKPFERETGIQVVFAPRPNLALGQLKSMVKANHVEWDLTYLTDYLAVAAAKDGLLDRIDYSKIDPKRLQEMLPGTVTPYMVGGELFGTVQAYSTQKWPAGKGPRNWADFWDVKRFPGRRSMAGFSYGPIEPALLADGVPKDKLYPLDLPRAFKKLDEIRPHVNVWSTSSAQQYQLLVNDEVDLIQGFANRIESAIANGAPYAVQWQDGSVNHEGWVLPKGAGNRATALRLINFMLDARRQAESVTGSGPTNKLSSAFMPENVARSVPTHPDNLAKLYRPDAAWLAENQQELQARWTRWRTG